MIGTFDIFWMACSNYRQRHSTRRSSRSSLLSSRAMSIPKAEYLAHKLVHHGREIFAYNNVHTNQVVYSLERSLNVRCPADSHFLYADICLEPSCDEATSICRQDHCSCEPTKRSLATTLGSFIPITTARTRCLSQTTRMEKASRALLGSEGPSRARSDGRGADQHGEATQRTTRKGR